MGTRSARGTRDERDEHDRDGDDDSQHGRSAATTLALVFLITSIVVGYLAWTGYRDRQPDRSVEAYCSHVQEVKTFDQALGSLDPKAVSSTIPKLQALADVSPADIEPQVRTVLDTSRSLVDALGKAGKDDGEALREVWRSKQPELQRIQAAGKALERYSQDQCHVALVTVPVTTPTPAPR